MFLNLPTKLISSCWLYAGLKCILCCCNYVAFQIISSLLICIGMELILLFYISDCILNSACTAPRQLSYMASILKNTTNKKSKPNPLTPCLLSCSEIGLNFFYSSMKEDQFSAAFSGHLRISRFFFF